MFLILAIACYSIYMKIKDYLLRPGEKPLDVIKPDCGFLSIFKTVGIIGGSVSSGEFESRESGKTGYHDFHSYSWAHYLATVTGSDYRVYARGGMTAEEYYKTWADQFGYWEPRQAYILMLGGNDLFTFPRGIGKAEDVDLEHPENNDETYIGYMARVLSKLKSVQPDCYLFVIGPLMKLEPGRKEICDEAYAELSKLCGRYSRAYHLELAKYGFYYDEDWNDNFKMGGHPNPMGYVIMAQAIGNYIDYLIRANPNEFKEVAFIGTPYRY